MKKNSKGYQVEFRCMDCGKEFTLDNLYYIHESGRLCNKCFKKFKNVSVVDKLNRYEKLREEWLLVE